MAMYEEKNKPKKRSEGLDGQRNICRRRASTISYMIEEAKKQGISDDFARQAIYRYGQDIGEEMLKEIKDHNDLKEFREHFAAMPHHDIYEMSLEEDNPDNFTIHFHYCPYVEEWAQQGYSGDELAHLCDITMEGDRAIGDCFENFEFRLGKTIAQDNDVCEIFFTKKNKGESK